MTELKVRWMDDLKVESDMREMSVLFDNLTISVKQIDISGSMANGARIDSPFVQELIDDYKVAMENGDVFPRIVVHKAPTGYVILCGNQRFGAVRKLIEDGKLAKDEGIEVYVAKTTDKMLLEAIARSDNCRHGGRTSYIDRVQHALYMVRKMGMTTKNAGRLFVISDSTISTHLRAEKERESLLSSGIDASRVTVKTLDVLARIKGDDRSKRMIGSLVAMHNPKTELVSQVVARAVKAKSDTERVQIIKNLEHELAEAAHVAQPMQNGRAKVPKRPRRDALIGCLTRLANLLDHGLDGDGFTALDQMQIGTNTDLEAVKTLWQRVRLRMGRMVK